MPELLPTGGGGGRSNDDDDDVEVSDVSAPMVIGFLIVWLDKQVVSNPIHIYRVYSARGLGLSALICVS